MALLVSQQGEVLDRIEENVSRTNDFSHSALENMSKANAYGKSNRKKMCILIWILGCVCCVILIPTVPFAMAMSSS